jgi:hypothetical protein
MRGAAAAKAGWLMAALAVLLPLQAAADAPLRGAALGAGVEMGADLVRSPLWPANAQSRISLRLLLETGLYGPLGLGFALGYHFVDASDPAVGVLYRGHHGLEVAANLLLRSALAPDRPRLGLAAGGSANFDLYSRTELLFFYPAIMIEPYLELATLGPPRHAFGLGLPCRWSFRRDLEVSGSIGLALSWRWYPGWRKQ